MVTTAPQAERLHALIDADLPHAIEVRHAIHRQPGLMFEEHATRATIEEELTRAGIEHVAGLAGGTGVLAHLPATESPTTAPTVGLRADMDALPITEATGAPYASEHPGVMHACGHDGHTAMLLAVARVLKDAPARPNNVTFLFQPAEEGGAGGEKMVADGALDGSRLGNKVDMLFGQHGWPQFPLGSLATKPGPLLASCDEFWVTITGAGGHAAMPHVTADPVVAAAQIVTALQTVVSRNITPTDGAVVSVTDISTPNNATNVIPPYARLVGTTRTLSTEARETCEKRIREVCAGVASAMGCTAQVEYARGYPVTDNAPAATEQFLRIARAAFGEDRVNVLDAPFMGAEDFSYYCKVVPSCFYLIGLQEGDKPYPGLHTPEFDFNDKAFPIGVRAMCALATTPLE